ncbi:MAG: response regulator transcription factor [Candidatus Eremiobacteraeota bacterium]|nr:response regulator transcription factor [Candidatus Eremiobacteraeota bacterium]
MKKRRPKENIRVLIADDHTLFREMLYHALTEEDDLEVVGQAIDGKSALDMVKFYHPDVLVLDIDMPGMNGIEVTRQLKESSPDTRVVILTAFDEDEYIFQLVEAGASGYLLKDTSLGEVIRAIHIAYSGESLIQPSVADKILREFARLIQRKKTAQGKDLKLIEKLTDREVEVLRLVSKGLNNKEISACLHISDPTVKSHVSNIMHKLNLRDRIEMVVFGIKTGIIEE